MEFGIVVMEDYGSSAIFVSINRSTVLDFSKDFITEILGIKFLSIEENVKHAKAEQLL
jgi:hypothetical protein